MAPPPPPRPPPRRARGAAPATGAAAPALLTLLLLCLALAPAAQAASSPSGSVLPAANLSAPLYANPGNSFHILLKDSTGTALSYTGLNLGPSSMRASTLCPAALPDASCPDGTVLNVANGALYVGPSTGSAASSFEIFFSATRADTYTLTLYVGDTSDTTGTTYAIPAAAVAALGTLVVKAGPVAGATAAGPALTGGAAGAALALTVQPTDLFGNAVANGGAAAPALYAFDAAGAAAPTAGSYSAAGLWSGTVTPAAAGAMSLYITVADSSDASLIYGATGAPFYPTITPGAAKAATSSFFGAVGSGYGAAAGAWAYFFVQAADAAGNTRTAGGDTFRVAAAGTSDASGAVTYATVSGASVVISDLGTGQYKVGYKFASVGTYVLNVTLLSDAGALVSGSPVLVTVAAAAGAISAAKSLVFSRTLSAGTAAAGASVSALVFAVDASGVALAAGGAAIVPGANGAALAASAYSVVDNADGSYLVTLAGVVMAGTYSVGLYLGTVGAANVLSPTGSVLKLPAALAITPAPTNAAATSVVAASVVGLGSYSAGGTASAQVGTAVSLPLSAKDAYGNTQVYSFASDEFDVSVTDATDGSPCLAFDSATYTYGPCLVAALSGGAYAATGSFQTVGTFKVAITLGGTVITGGSFSVAVAIAAAGVSASMSYLRDNALGADGLESATAGNTGTFFVYPLDSYGNVVPQADVTCAATLTGGPAAVTPTCAASSTDLDAFVVTYRATQAGSYTPGVTLQGGTAAAIAVPLPLYGTGALVVSVGAVSAAKSSLLIANRPTFAFGASWSWAPAVRAADAYGNAYTSSPGAGNIFTLLFTSTTSQVTAALTAVPEDQYDGTFSLYALDAYFFPAPAMYTISATYGGVDIVNSPVAGVAVAAKATAAANSQYTQIDQTYWGGDGQSYLYLDPQAGTADITAVQGQAVTLFVALFDGDGNPQVYSDNSAIVVDSVLGTPSWSAINVTGVFWPQIGAYNVTFTPPTIAQDDAGATLTVLINGASAGVFSFVVYPGSPSASASSALGPLTLAEVNALYPTQTIESFYDSASVLGESFFVVTAADALGSNFTLVHTPPLPPAIEVLSDATVMSTLYAQQSDGRFVVSASCAASGAHVLNVTAGAAVIVSIAVTYAAGALVPTNTAVGGAGEPGATLTAGAAATLSLTGQDSFNNSVAFAGTEAAATAGLFAISDVSLRHGQSPYRNLNVSGGILSTAAEPVVAFNAATGKYEATFTPLLSGVLSFKVALLRDTGSGLEPFAVSVPVGPGARAAVALLSPTTVAAGAAAVVVAAVRDAQGNAAEADCALLTLAFAPALTSTLSGRGAGGECVFAVSAPPAGSFAGSFSYHSAALGSGFTLTAQSAGAGAPVAASTIFTGAFVSGAVLIAGVPAVFDAILVSAGGVLTGPGAGATLAAAFVDLGNASATVGEFAVANNGDGTLSAAFTATAAGAYTLARTLNGAAIDAAALSFTVVPGPASALMTQLWASGNSPITCPNDVTIYAALLDGFGNALTSGPFSVLTNADPLMVQALDAGGAPVGTEQALTLNVTDAAAPVYYLQKFLSTSGVLGTQMAGAYTASLYLASAPGVPVGALTVTYVAGAVVYDADHVMAYSDLAPYSEGMPTQLSAGIADSSLYIYAADACGTYTADSFVNDTTLEIQPRPPMITLYRVDSTGATANGTFNAAIGSDPNGYVAYNPTVLITQPGSYYLRIAFGNATRGFSFLHPGPFANVTFDVVAGAVSAAASNVSFPSAAYSVAADATALATLLPLDAYGNGYITAGDPGAPFAITYTLTTGASAGYVAGPDDVIFNAATGAYVLSSYPGTLFIAGTYSVAVTLNGEPTGNSGLLSFVVTAGATAAASYLTLGNYVAGTPNMITCQGVDEFGNNVTTTADAFYVYTVVNGGAASAAVRMASLGAGSYGTNLTLTVATPGGPLAYTTVQFPLGSDSYDAFGELAQAARHVYAAAPAAAQSVAVLLTSAPVPAGAGSIVQVTPYDASGNVNTTSSAIAVQVAAGDTTVKAAAVGDGSGTFRATLALTKAGGYILVASLANADGTTAPLTPATPLALTVVAAAPDSAMTEFSGANPSAFTAGSASTFGFYVRDSYGNVITQGADSGSVSLALAVVSSSAGVASGVVPGAAFVDADSAGLTTVTFTSAIAGAGTLALSYTVFGQPFTLETYQISANGTAYPVNAALSVLPGAVDAAKSYAFGSGVSVGPLALATGTFYIQLNDASGNGIVAADSSTPSVTITSPLSFSPNSVSTPTVTWDAASRLYVATYALNALADSTGVAPGSFLMTVQYNGNPLYLEDLTTALSNRLFSIKASTAAPDASAMRLMDAHAHPLTASALLTVAGAATQLYIQLADASGVELSSTTFGGVDYLAQLSYSVQPTPTSTATLAAVAGTGRASLGFSATRAGTYTVTALLGDYVIGAYVAYTPLEVTVVAGPTAGASALVYARGGSRPAPTAPLALAAGAMGYLHVVSRDAYGNLRPYASAADEDPYLCRMVLTSDAANVTVAGTRTNFKNGHYEMGYGSTRAGVFSLMVSLPDGSVAYSNTLTVSPGAFSVPLSSVLAASQPATCQATVACGFTVQALDVYGNAYGSSDLGLIVSASPAAGGTAVKGTATAIAGAAAGLWAASFVPAATGTVTVAVTERKSTQQAKKYGLEAPALGTFSITVTLGPASPTTSLVRTGPGFGDGLTSAKAEKAAMFTVNLQDAAGNDYTAAAPMISYSLPLRTAATVALNGTRWAATYTPAATGALTVSVQVQVGTNLLHILGSPFSLAVSAADPPVLTSATMTDDAAGFTAVFDAATDGAGMEASDDCALILGTSTLAKLGTNPSCVWTPLDTGGATQLGVRFGAGATILPKGVTGGPDQISLKSGALRNVYGTSSYATSQTDLLAPAAASALVGGVSTLTPEPALAGPSTVGVCELGAFDASGSRNGAGRPMAYTWGIAAAVTLAGVSCSTAPKACPKLAALRARLKSASKSDPVLVIGRDEIDVAASYTLTLTVANYLVGVQKVTSASISYTFVKKSTVVPTIQIIATQTYAVAARPAAAPPTAAFAFAGLLAPRSSQLTLRARALLASAYTYVASNASCMAGIEGDPVPLSFQWFGEKLAVSALSGDLSAAASSKSLASIAELTAATWPAEYSATAATNELVFPAGVLALGAYYKFTVKGTSTAVASQVASDTAVVFVTNAPPTLTVVGGASKSATAAAGVTVAVAASDPTNATDATGAPLSFSYAWKLTACPAIYNALDATRKPTVACTTASRPLPAAIKSPVLSAANNTVTIPANVLTAGQYVFSVTASIASAQPPMGVPAPSAAPSTGMRTATATVTVNVVGAAAAVANPVDVTISPVASASAFDSALPLALSCLAGASTAAPFYDAPYEWAVSDPLAPSLNMSTLLGGAASGLTPYSSAVLVPAGALSPGHAYTFSCCTPACAPAAAVAGMGAVTVRTVAYPSSGTATVTYDASYPLPTTEFTIAMANWVPAATAGRSDLICYQYGYMLDGGSEQLLGVPTPEPRFAGIFPAGSLQFLAYVLTCPAAGDSGGGPAAKPSGTRVLATVPALPSGATASTGRRLLATKGSLSLNATASALYLQLRKYSAQKQLSQAISTAGTIGRLLNGLTNASGAAAAPRPAAACSAAPTPGAAANATAKAALLAQIQTMISAAVPSASTSALIGCTFQQLAFSPKDLPVATAATLAASLVKTVTAPAASKPSLALQASAEKCTLAALDYLLNVGALNCGRRRGLLQSSPATSASALATTVAAANGVLQMGQSFLYGLAPGGPAKVYNATTGTSNFVLAAKVATAASLTSLALPNGASTLTASAAGAQLSAVVVTFNGTLIYDPTDRYGLGGSTVGVTVAISGGNAKAAITGGLTLPGANSMTLTSGYIFGVRKWDGVNATYPTFVERVPPQNVYRSGDNIVVTGYAGLGTSGFYVITQEIPPPPPPPLPPTPPRPPPPAAMVYIIVDAVSFTMRFIDADFRNLSLPAFNSTLRANYVADMAPAANVGPAYVNMTSIRNGSISVDTKIVQDPIFYWATAPLNIRTLAANLAKPAYVVQLFASDALLGRYKVECLNIQLFQVRVLAAAPYPPPPPPPAPPSPPPPPVNVTHSAGARSAGAPPPGLALLLLSLGVAWAGRWGLMGPAAPLR